ncbi:unnamed protein product, partial [Didymodactylos carnosus]
MVVLRASDRYSNSRVRVGKNQLVTQIQLETSKQKYFNFYLNVDMTMVEIQQTLKTISKSRNDLCIQYAIKTIDTKSIEIDHNICIKIKG